MNIEQKLFCLWHHPHVINMSIYIWRRGFKRPLTVLHYYVLQYTLLFHICKSMCNVLSLRNSFS